jgi:transposase
MKNLLTSKEKEKLISRHRRERDKRICDRIKAVLAYDEGYTYSEIARILLLDDETIRRHIEDYRREQKLLPQNGGSESKLNTEECRELREHLEEITYLYVKDICQYVKRKYQKNYSVGGMTKWLRANRFCYKKPHGVPAKADKEQQKSFIDFYNELKISAGEKEPIYFADSVHPQHQTQLAYGWILKGQRKAIPTTGQQKRLNFIGGICLQGHRFIYQQVDKVNADGVALFLSELRKKNPGKHLIHVILDNAGYHHDKKIKQFAEDLGIKLHYLPPYSPNLNPIERLWKIMRERVTYNQYYGNFKDFTGEVVKFFKTIGRNKSILRSRITDNFQILHSPLFAS